jgi:putative oxidoreductase
VADENPFAPKPNPPKAAASTSPAKSDAAQSPASKPDASKLYVPEPPGPKPTAPVLASSPGSTRLLIPAFGRLYALFAPITEPLIRLMAGGSLAFHGSQILFGNIEGAARFFESLDFQNGLLWAWVVGVLEFVCGICLALGLFTRLAAGPILVFLITSIATYHYEFGYSWEARGIEYPLFWAIVVFHFLVRGGGKWSLDHLIGREI